MTQRWRAGSALGTALEAGTTGTRRCWWVCILNYASKINEWIYIHEQLDQMLIASLTGSVEKWSAGGVYKGGQIIWGLVVKRLEVMQERKVFEGVTHTGRQTQAMGRR
jgi:hypothetical protein